MSLARPIPTLLIAALLAGCGGAAGTASPGVPDASAVSVAASASPTPDPSERSAAAYLALATKVTSQITAAGTLSPGASLAVVKDYYARLARIQADLVAGIRAIAFPPALKDAVDDLIRTSQAVHDVEAGIAASASPAELRTRAGRLTAAITAMNAAATRLRRSLGLPPTPTPTPSPTPEPSPAASVDPAADLTIGPPYSLKKIDAATMANVQATIDAAAGPLATLFRVGARWVYQGGGPVAIVAVLEQPGIAGSLASPQALDEIARGIAGTDSTAINGGTVLGHSVRLFYKGGAPLVLYIRGEGIVMLQGPPGTGQERVIAIAAELIRAQT